MELDFFVSECYYFYTEGCGFMDCIKELWDRNLPNFGYVIYRDDGGQYVVILGGQSALKVENCCFLENICRRNEQMKHIYRQDNLSDSDKTELAKLMRKMFSLCDAREEHLYTREEQATFIEKLTQNERSQLEMQIQMLKDCRNFYREYVF